MREKKDQESDQKMTPQQEIFCVEYLKDFNATKAAIRAGYSQDTARSAGSRLLTFVNIRKRLRESIDAVLGDKTDDLKRILDELRLVAFGDIKDVIDWEDRSITVRQPSEMGNKSRMILEMSETLGAMSTTRKVKLHDKMRAIELLGRYYKLFTDKIEHSSPDGSMTPQVCIYLPKNGRES